MSSNNATGILVGAAAIGLAAWFILRQAGAAPTEKGSTGPWAPYASPSATGGGTTTSSSDTGGTPGGGNVTTPQSPTPQQINTSQGGAPTSPEPSFNVPVLTSQLSQRSVDAFQVLADAPSFTEYAANGGDVSPETLANAQVIDLFSAPVQGPSLGASHPFIAEEWHAPLLLPEAAPAAPTPIYGPPAPPKSAEKKASRFDA